MKLVELTEFLVKSLVSEPDMVSIKYFDDDEFTIELVVASDDMGRVIGKNGSNINAIRTIIQAASYMNDNKKVIINVDSF